MERIELSHIFPNSLYKQNVSKLTTMKTKSIYLPINILIDNGTEEIFLFSQPQKAIHDLKHLIKTQDGDWDTAADCLSSKS